MKRAKLFKNDGQFGAALVQDSDLTEHGELLTDIRWYKTEKRAQKAIFNLNTKGRF